MKSVMEGMILIHGKGRQWTVCPLALSQAEDITDEERQGMYEVKGLAKSSKIKGSFVYFYCLFVPLFFFWLVWCISIVGWEGCVNYREEGAMLIKSLINFKLAHILFSEYFMKVQLTQLCLGEDIQMLDF